MWVKPSRYLSTTQPLTYPLLPLTGIGDEEWNRKRKKENQLGFNIKAVLKSGTREKEKKGCRGSHTSPPVGRPMPSQVMNNRWQTELKPHSFPFLWVGVTLHASLWFVLPSWLCPLPNPCAPSSLFMGQGKVQCKEQRGPWCCANAIQQ